MEGFAGKGEDEDGRSACLHDRSFVPGSGSFANKWIGAKQVGFSRWGQGVKLSSRDLEAGGSSRVGTCADREPEYGRRPRQQQGEYQGGVTFNV